MNTSQKKWMMKDYIQLHVDLGNEHYIDLANFVKENKLTPSIGILLLSNQTYTKSKVADFREGRWTVSKWDEGHETVEAMRRLMPKMRQSVIYRSTAFAAAMVKTGDILAKNNLTFDHLIEQAEKSQVLLTYSVRVRDYLKELEDMLNYQRKANLIRLV